MDDRIKSQITIVQATGELDSSGAWQDTNGDGNFDIFAWVKNVGTSRISSIGQSDVFCGEEGDFERIPYIDDAGGQYPYWEYQVENDTEWGTAATLKIEISYSSALSQGTYFLKVVVPNGISDEHYFSM